MAENTGKTAAAALAKELLRDRIALVNELGAQIDHHKTKVAAAVEAQSIAQDAAEHARQAYTAAIVCTGSRAACRTTSRACRSAGASPASTANQTGVELSSSSAPPGARRSSRPHPRTRTPSGSWCSTA